MTKHVITLKDRVIQCLLDMNNHNIKGIATCYNNDSILKCLGRKKEAIPPLVQGSNFNIIAEKW